MTDGRHVVGEALVALSCEGVGFDVYRGVALGSEVYFEGGGCGGGRLAVEGRYGSFISEREAQLAALERIEAD